MISENELKEILRLHELWLEYKSGGRQADLQHASLQDADLRCANLKYADLRCANLKYADLRYANLQDAELQGADLRYANLQYADLRYANLMYADLQDANLQDAELHNANLQCAKLKGVCVSGDTRGYFLRCPEVGEFMAFKKCVNGDIVTLKIPEDAKRSSATTSKCRCDKAFVVAIEDRSGCAKAETISRYDENFIYRVGETVKVDNFNEDRWVECAPGIHFFLTKKEAASF